MPKHDRSIGVNFGMQKLLTFIPQCDNFVFCGRNTFNSIDTFWMHRWIVNCKQKTLFDHRTIQVRCHSISLERENCWKSIDRNYLLWIFVVFFAPFVSIFELSFWSTKIHEINWKKKIYTKMRCFLPFEQSSHVWHLPIFIRLEYVRKCNSDWQISLSNWLREWVCITSELVDGDETKRDRESGKADEKIFWRLKQCALV